MIQFLSIVLLSITTFTAITKSSNGEGNKILTQSILNTLQTTKISGVFICEKKTPVVNKYDVVILKENGIAGFGTSDLDPSTFMLNDDSNYWVNNTLIGRFTISGNKISISVDGDIETYTMKISSITGKTIGIVSSLTGDTYSKVK
jgi:hypothetical protein